ncbi:MAG: hypothetical protein ACFB2W_22625 [Leptolyngbyaceae cyanobacterium]
MWPLSHPVVNPAAFSFAGDGPNTQLWQNDVRLINALSHVNWTDTDANFQFEVCETCGCPRCEPGGWISLR